MLAKNLQMSTLGGMLSGVIFDWDGVIVDSGEPHRKSWEIVAKKLGKVLPDHYFERSFGLKNTRLIPEILGWTRDPEEIERISDRKEEIYREVVKKEGIKTFPGLMELLDELNEKKIPYIIASSTARVNIEFVLSFLGIGNYFPLIVSAEDVVNGKPAPDIFLKALGILGCPREECVILEDAPAGIKAGLTAGIKVVGIGTSHAISELVGAQFIVESLKQLKLSDIEGILNQPLS